MSGFNQVILIGNLTRDVEVKFGSSGTAYATVGLAVNRSWFDKQSNQRKEEVEFVDVKLWGKTAENVGEYCRKGSPLFVMGRIHTDSWNDRQSGEKRYKTLVVAESVQFLGSKSGASSPRESYGEESQEPRQEQRRQAPKAEPQPAWKDDVPEDDVPF